MPGARLASYLVALQLMRSTQFRKVIVMDNDAGLLPCLVRRIPYDHRRPAARTKCAYEMASMNYTKEQYDGATFLMESRYTSCRGVTTLAPAAAVGLGVGQRQDDASDHRTRWAGLAHSQECHDARRTVQIEISPP